MRPCSSSPSPARTPTAPSPCTREPRITWSPDAIPPGLLPRAVRYAVAQRRLHHRARHGQDDATGLPNLRGFATIAEHHLRMADRSHTPGGLRLRAAGRTTRSSPSRWGRAGGRTGARRGRGPARGRARLRPARAHRARHVLRAAHRRGGRRRDARALAPRRGDRASTTRSATSPASSPSRSEARSTTRSSPPRSSRSSNTAGRRLTEPVIRAPMRREYHPDDPRTRKRIAGCWPYSTRSEPLGMVDVAEAHDRELRPAAAAAVTRMRSGASSAGTRRPRRRSPSAWCGTHIWRRRSCRKRSWPSGGIRRATTASGDRSGPG